MSNQEMHPLIQAILDELQSNPDFADILVAALPKELLLPKKKSTKRAAATPKQNADGEITKKQPEKAAKKTKAVKDEVLSLTSIYTRKGEAVLREFLGEKTAKQLQGLAKKQQIPVDSSAFKETLGVLHDALIAGVKFRVAERLAASS